MQDNNRRSALRGCEKERGALLLAPGLRLAAALSPSRLSASLSVADTDSEKLSSDFSALRALGLPPCTCANASAYLAGLAYVFVSRIPGPDFSALHASAWPTSI